jgi:hypothetical protein
MGTSAGLSKQVKTRSALLVESPEPGDYEVLPAQITPVSEQVVQVLRYLEAVKLAGAYVPLHQLLEHALRRTSEVWYLVWTVVHNSLTSEFQDVPFVTVYTLDAVRSCESVLTTSPAEYPHTFGQLMEYTMLHRATVTMLPADRKETRRTLLATVLRHEQRREAHRKSPLAARLAELDRMREEMLDQQRQAQEEWAQRQGVLPSTLQMSEDEARERYRQWQYAGRRVVGDQMGIPGGRVDAPAAAEARTGEPHE